MTPLRLAVGWSAFVLALCSVPGPALPPAPFELLALDKLVHAALFVGVGGLWLRAAPDRPLAVFLGCVAFGVGIEVWQQVLPLGRYAEAADAVADAVGAALGIALLRVRSAAR